MRTPRAQDGAVLLLVTLSLTVLLGMAALVIDLGQFRAHRRQLQTAADAGALAGALQLPPFSDGSNSCARAASMERQNSNLTDGKNMVVNGNLSTSYCQIIGGSVRVKPVESSVPYVFGRVLGFASTTIDARARARVVYLTRSTGLLPFGVEDLRPQTVTLFLGADPNNPVQTWPMGIGGCQAPTPEGYPYWCTTGSVHINSLPAGGLPLGLKVVDTTNKTITWSYVGYVGSSQTIPGTTISVDNAQTLPVTQTYYYSSSTPPSLTLQAHLTGVSGQTIQFSYDGSKFSTATSLGSGWYQAVVPGSGAESAMGQPLLIRAGNNKNAPKTSAPVINTYARDDGDILQQLTQSVHFLPNSGGNIAVQGAFQVLVKGREITLKLGGGGAQGNSGNYAGLDLDATNGSGACHGDTAGTPNAAEEVQYGACTPYSIGDSVNTQTGNFAGQVNNGLSARIGNSPDNWTTTANPPPPGDPRWMSLILVPPITFSNCTGNCTTQVVGFGSFYITEYAGQQGSNLKQGEVRGIFWDRPVLINQYTTTCNDPQGICLASVALMPWDG
jgi:hypothetical protein